MKIPRTASVTEIRIAQYEQARIRRASARFAALDPRTGKPWAVVKKGRAA